MAEARTEQSTPCVSSLKNTTKINLEKKIGYDEFVAH